MEHTPFRTTKLHPLRETPARRAFPRHHRELPAPYPGFRSLGRGAGRHQRAGCLLERALNRQRLPPGTVNTMLVSLNRFLGFLGWHDCVVKTLRIQRRLFREDSKELTPRGVRAPGFHRTGQWPGAAGASVGNHLLHRYPRLRGQVYHRRGPPSWKSGNLPEGQDTHHPAAQQAVPEAAEVCQKQKTVSGEVFLTRTAQGFPENKFGRR